MNNIPKNSTIIIGFSGGPDSVYLLEHLLQNGSYNLIAAHLDHEWRSDSAQDVAWCKNHCAKRNVSFVSEAISKLAMKKPTTGSREANARLYRRHFLESIAQKYPNSFIALGHHIDDQIETFFIRLARGTTLAGLGCIKQQDGLYIRPLLQQTKQKIIDYLEKKKIPFLIDKTNKDTTLLRNNIRKHIVPQLQKTDHRFIKNIERTILNLQKQYVAFEQLTQQVENQIKKEDEINIKQFLNLPEIIQHELISKQLIHKQCNVTQSASLFKEIIRFIKHGTQKRHAMHATCFILKQSNSFSIKNDHQKK